MLIKYIAVSAYYALMDIIAYLQCAQYFKNYTCSFAVSVNVLTILVPGTSECAPSEYCMLKALSFIILHARRRSTVNISGVGIIQMTKHFSVVAGAYLTQSRP